METKIFLDASFVLEILLQRNKGETCLQWLNTPDKICISPLTAHLIFYFGVKAGLSFEYCALFTNQFTILPLDESMVYKAQKICPNKDFEDALQVACALAGNAHQFYTLDRQLAQDYDGIMAITLV